MAVSSVFGSLTSVSSAEDLNGIMDNDYARPG